MTTDLTFITNEKGKHLKDRFDGLIKDARLFDCLVGISTNKEWPWSDPLASLLCKGEFSDKKTEQIAREIFRETYIHHHLSQYEDKLRKCADQGQFWWELRSCAYYAEFEGPKIIIPAIIKGVEYALDKDGFYSNDKNVHLCS